MRISRLHLLSAKYSTRGTTGFHETGLGNWVLQKSRPHTCAKGTAPSERFWFGRRNRAHMKPQGSASVRVLGMKPRISHRSCSSIERALQATCRGALSLTMGIAATLIDVDYLHESWFTILYSSDPFPDEINLRYDRTKSTLAALFPGLAVPPPSGKNLERPDESHSVGASRSDHPA